MKPIAKLILVLTLQAPAHRTQTFEGVVYTDGKMLPPLPVANRGSSAWP
jgi:hypothetical protein